MSRARVAGVMFVRNEWPLMAASVSNALTHHVDRLWIFDHASDDESIRGLAALCDLWGDRLVAYRLEDVPFLQGALATVALVLLRHEPFEWVYFIDADEFGLVGATPLRDVLGGVPADISVVRYSINNWVAPREWNDFEVERLGDVRARATANSFMSLPGEMLAEQIECGDLNYFDLTFPSKIIVRNGSTLSVGAGAHGLSDNSSPRELALEPEAFSVAHLPLLSRSRLALRVRNGQKLIEDGFDFDHGWQSQLIRRLALSGAVDEFWRRHSLASGPESDGPRYVRDDSFASTIRPIVTMLATDPRLMTPEALTGDEGAMRSLPMATLLEAISLLHVVLAERALESHRDREVLAHEVSVLADVLRHTEESWHQLEEHHDKVLSSSTWRWGRRVRSIARFGRS